MPTIEFLSPTSGDTITGSSSHLVAYDLTVGTVVTCLAVDTANNKYSHSITSVEQNDFHASAFAATLPDGTYTFTTSDGTTTGTAANVIVDNTPPVEVVMTLIDLDPAGTAQFQAHVMADRTNFPDIGIKVQVEKYDLATMSFVRVVSEGRLFATCLTDEFDLYYNIDFDPASTVPIWPVIRIRYRYTPPAGPAVTKFTRAAADVGIVGTDPYSKLLTFRLDTAKLRADPTAAAKPAPKVKARR